MSKRRVPSKEEVIKAGYSPEAADRIVARETEEAAAECPTYTLRADVPEHRETLFGMLRAARELKHALLPDLEKAAREFELYLDGVE